MSDGGPRRKRAARDVPLPIAAALAALMAACTSTGERLTDEERTMRETAYLAGRQDGCHTGAQLSRGLLRDRDAHRYHTDMDYRAGWDAGYDDCLYRQRRHFIVHDGGKAGANAHGVKHDRGSGADPVPREIDRRRERSGQSEKTGAGDVRRESEKTGAGHGGGREGRGPNY